MPAWGHRSPLKTTPLSFYWCAHASYFALNGASEGQQLTNWTKGCNSPSPLLFWRIEGDALKPTSLLFLNTPSCPLHSLTCAWSAVRQKVLILVMGPQKDPTGQNGELTRDLYIDLFHPTLGCISCRYQSESDIYSANPPAQGPSLTSLCSTQHSSQFCAAATTGIWGNVATDNYIILDLSDSINIDCTILHACLSRITLSQGNSQCKLLLSMTNMEDKTIGLPTSFLIQNTQNAHGRWGVFIWGYLWQFSHKKYHQFPSLAPVTPELVGSYLTSSKNSNLWSAFLGEQSMKYENKDFLITPYQPFIL